MMQGNLVLGAARGGATLFWTAAFGLLAAAATVTQMVVPAEVTPALRVGTL